MLTNQSSHLKAECSSHQHQLLAVAEEGRVRDARHQAEREAWDRQREGLEVRSAHTARQFEELEKEHGELKGHLEMLLVASDAGPSVDLS